MQIPSVSPDNVRGIADKVVGLGKEILGTVIDDASLRDSGRTQQRAGSERLAAVEEEVKAKAREAQAHTADLAERTARQRKERAS